MTFAVNTTTYHTITIPGSGESPEHHPRATTKAWKVLKSALLKLIDASSNDNEYFDKEIVIEDNGILIDPHDGTSFYITATTTNDDGEETFFLYDDLDDEWDIVLTRSQVEKLIATIDSLE